MTLHNSAFIFDIDGTLVDLRKIWENTYNGLYQQQCGFTLTDAEMKSMFGPPELECHTAILRGRNLYTEKRAQELVQCTEDTMLLTLAKTDVISHIISEVIPCLQKLQQHNSHLAIATGNIGSIAKEILAHSGLQDYFPVVSFSSPDTQERYQIVEKAKQGLEEKFGTPFALTATYVIGDTPSDIKAAKKLGFVSVGVATGNYSLQELAQHNPDLLLRNLAELVRKI